VLHEHLEADVVGKDGGALRAGAVGAAGHVCGGRVQLGEKEACLRAVLVAHNIAGDREALEQELLRIGLWHLEDLAEVFVALLVLVPRLAPLRDGLAMEDEQVEERIEQQHNVGANRHRVEQHGRWRPLESVRHERRLDHDERVVHVLAVEYVPVVRRLVRRVVKHLQELAAAQVEHELGVDVEILAQAEARRVVLAVLGKLLAQADQHAVEPAQHVGTVVDLRLEHGNTRHEHSCGFLVEREANVTRLAVRKVARNRRHTQAELTRCVLVVRHKLDQPPRARLQWLASRRRHLEVHARTRARRHRAHLPRGRLADANLRLAHARRLFVR